MRTAKRSYLQILLVFLTITLMFPRLTLAEVTQLDEVRFFLSNYYVEPVKEDILNAPTVDTLLAKLADPYTILMSSQDFQNFNNSVEQRFVGIGINIDIIEQGVKIINVVKGSPAEQSGLQAGDIITALDGRSVKGLSLEEVIPLIRGAEGSYLQITYQRAATSSTVRVERMNITIPSITGEIKAFNTGYMQLTSFGSDTGRLFGTCLDNLRLQNPQAYIVDLRDNGGGYGQTALDIAGYFIGNDISMQVYYRDSEPLLLRAVKHDYVVDKPTILLVNHNSASASEALSLAIKDHGKAVLVGTQTYGKGCGQQIFPLSGGGYFKMTTSYYRGPLSVSINNKGITPDLLIEKEDPLKVSLLLLSGSDSAVKDGLVKLNLGSQSFYIDTRSACQKEYWPAFGEILDRAGSTIMIGQAGNWAGAPPQAMMDRRMFYYPDYKLGNDTPGLIADNAFKIHFPQEVDWQFINDKIQLIASGSGERIPLIFTPAGTNDLHVTVQKKPAA